jgi:hypothetical protein
LQSSGQADRTGVVDQDIDPAKPLDRAADRCLHLLFRADIDLHG